MPHDLVVVVGTLLVGEVMSSDAVTELKGSVRGGTKLVTIATTSSPQVVADWISPDKVAY